MPILGLLDTEDLSSVRFKNVRRQVFYQYPNGKAPLTGLLSLAKDEETDDPEFSWWEKRMGEQSSTMAYISTTVAFYKTWTLPDTVAVADGNITIAANGVPSAGVLYGVKVADYTKFRVGHVVKFNVINASAAIVELLAVVKYVHVSNSALAIQFVSGVGTVIDYDAAHTGFEVLVVGSAFSQGYTDQSGATTAGYSSSQPYTLPISLANYCQIFRSPFLITGTAMKTGLKYDDSGAYKDQAKEASIAHAIELEKAFIWGSKYQDTSVGTPVTNYMGGILYWLGLWEAGSTYSNTAATLLAHDNKRILNLTATDGTSGVITEKAYDGYLERIFRTTNSQQNEKLVLCGSGFLSVLNQLYKSKSVLQADFPTKDAYGMNVVKHVCPFGTIYYKTHPLMSQNAGLRNNALFVDMGNIRYRYVQGRDTQLLKNRQANDADFRKDEWLTECGLELRFPESFAYFMNVTSYAP